MKKYIKALIDLALEEDLGEEGDVTSQAIFSGEESTYYLIAKDSGILCGKELFCEVFDRIDRECSLDFYFTDGDTVSPGDVIARVSGKVCSILTAERTALNFLSHLSGIATKTASFVSKADGRVKILDTRKTLPGYRLLAKYAVSCGGGQNHRTGLYDMVMIKDNHIDGAGSITKAVEKVREQWGSKFKIEVETRTLDEVEEALDCGADRIMLDNMTNDIMRKAVGLIGQKAEIEASGNMTYDRIDLVAQTGVDFISFGELTHSVKALDFSLRKE